MLPSATVPAGLLEVLAGCRGVLTAPTFVTFTLLVTGVLSGRAADGDGHLGRGRDGRRAHWSRAHRFFSHARWDPDAFGLALARLVLAASTCEGRALTVAVDDTLFHRYGRTVFGVA